MFFLLNGQMTGRPAGGKREPTAEHFNRGSSTQLLLIDSSKSSKAPFSLFSPTPFPYTLCYIHFWDFPSLPLFYPLSKDGEIRAEPLQRDTGGWLSGVLQRIKEEVGSGDGRRGVSWKEPTGSPCLGQLHAAQQQGQESPSGHCWLSPLYSYTHRHRHRHTH